MLLIMPEVRGTVSTAVLTALQNRRMRRTHLDHSMHQGSAASAWPACCLQYVILSSTIVCFGSSSTQKAEDVSANSELVRPASGQVSQQTQRAQIFSSNPWFGSACSQPQQEYGLTAHQLPTRWPNSVHMPIAEDVLQGGLTHQRTSSDVDLLSQLNSLSMV